MAINQRFNSTPGSAPYSYLEQPAEPGQPRLFWNGLAGASSTFAATPTSVPFVIDPSISGGFLFQVPSATSSTFPDKVYILHILDDNGMFKDPILAQRPIHLVSGDDGGNGIPSVNVSLSTLTVNGTPMTGTIKLVGAQMLPTS